VRRAIGVCPEKCVQSDIDEPVPCHSQRRGATQVSLSVQGRWDWDILDCIAVEDECDQDNTNILIKVYISS